MQETHQAATLFPKREPVLFVGIDDGDEVVVAVALLVLAKTYISPVASEDMKIRPWESSANPTGRKQSSGHFEVSAFDMISVRAVVLSAAATGEPAEKATEESL